jgi:hypothetical protein
MLATMMAGVSQPALGDQDAAAAWIEVEDGALSGDFTSTPHGSASNGSYVGMYTTAQGASGKAAFDLDLATSEDYDLWVLGTQVGVAWLSSFAWSVDGQTTTAVSDFNGPALYTNSNWLDMSWSRLGAEVPLESGSREFALEVNASRVQAPPLTVGFFDVFLAVPSSWNWIPSGFARPVHDPAFAWIEAELPQKAEGGWRAISESRASSQSVLLLDQATVPQPATARYSFDLDSSCSYDVWVLGTPGNIFWTSPLTWGIDGAPAQSFPAGEAPAAVYATAYYRALPVAWYRLGAVGLAGGRHSLEVTAAGVRPMAGDPLAIGVMDAIAVVPSAWGAELDSLDRLYNPDLLRVSYVSGSVNPQQASAGSTVAVEAVISPDQPASETIQLTAQVTRHGQVIAQAVSAKVSLAGVAAGAQVPVQLSIALPADAPNADASVQVGLKLGGFSNGNTAQAGALRIGQGESQGNAASEVAVDSLVTAGTVDSGGQLAFAAGVTPDQDLTGNLRPYLVFRQDGKVGAVAESEGAITVAWNQGTSTQVTGEVTIPDQIAAGTYQVSLGFHGLGATAQPPQTVTVASELSHADVLPLSAGFFEDSDGATHLWYVNQANTMYWDGEPFVPLGGMFLSKYIQSYSASDPAANEDNWTLDVAALQELKDLGMTDLYLNPVRSGVNGLPTWAWQRVIDKLEELGFRYGLQPNANTAGQGTMDIMAANADQRAGLTATGVEGDGRAGVTFSASAAWSGISRVDGASYVAVDQATGQVADAGAAQVSASGAGQWTLSVDLALPEGVYTVAFTPRATGSLWRLRNFWDNPDAGAQALANLTASLRLGPGFRVFIDPNANEEGILNAMESLRPVSSAYDAAFSTWLGTKYDDAAALSQAWQVSPEVDGFQTAARLVPQHLRPEGAPGAGDLILRDRVSGDVYTAAATGTAWDDNLAFRSNLYTDYLNATANAIKQVSDAPVIFKYTGAYKSYFEQTDPDAGSGFDGLGGENYGDGTDKVRQRASYSFSAAKSSARTMWLVTTETSTDENMDAKQSSGVFGYGDKPTMFRQLDANLAAGEKGIYDFLFNHLPYDGRLRYYAYTANPDQFTWLNEFRATRLGSDKIADLADYQPQDVYYSYPPGEMWWTSPTERSAVLTGDDFDGTGPLTTRDGKYLAPTARTNIGQGVLVVSIQDAPATTVWGEAIQDLETILAAGTQVVVMGHRINLGAIPQLDRYYTSEFVALGNGDVGQVLAPTGTAQVLYETNGKPWAVRDGNLWIIADNQWHTDEETVDYLHELEFFEVYKSVLEAAVAAGEATDASRYTASSYAGLEAVLADARSILESPDADQSQINQAVTTTNAAVAALVLRGDPAALAAVVAAIGAFDPALFSEDSWGAVLTALEAAETLLAGAADATQAEFDAVLEALSGAVASLLARPTDTAGLAAVLAAVAHLNPAAFDQASWAVFVQARTVAEAVASQGGSASAAAVAEALDDLLAAIAGLSPPASPVEVPPVSGPGLSRLEVAPGLAAANGSDLRTVVAHVTDGAGEPLAGRVVSFFVPAGVSAGLTSGPAAVPVTTDPSGSASLALTSETPGTYGMVASVGGVVISEGSPAMVVFDPVGGPPPGGPLAAPSVEPSNGRHVAGRADADDAAAGLVAVVVAGAAPGVEVARCPVALDGTFDCVLPGLTDGAELSVRVETADGSARSPQVVVAVDAVPPVPGATRASDGAALSGWGEAPGHTVVVRDSDANELCRAVVGADLGWECDLEPDAGEGDMVTVEHADLAGNTTIVPWRIGLPRVALGSASARAGEGQTAVGSSFQPGEQVTAVMRSDPLELGTQVADAAGQVAFAWELPMGLAGGQHEVELVGALSGLHTASFTVVAAEGPTPSDEPTPSDSPRPNGEPTPIGPNPSGEPTPSSSPTPTGGPTSSGGSTPTGGPGSTGGAASGGGGDLPWTGADGIAGLVLVMSGLLAAGAMLVFAARRRQQCR